MDNKNWRILAIAEGFYLFGNEVQAPEGYLALDNCAMFGGYGGGKGMPGVARGDNEATVTLDRFIPEDVQMFPVNNCYGIYKSINLYEFKGTTLR